MISSKSIVFALCNKHGWILLDLSFITMVNTIDHQTMNKQKKLGLSFNNKAKEKSKHYLSCHQCLKDKALQLSQHCACSSPDREAAAALFCHCCRGRLEWTCTLLKGRKQDFQHSTGQARLTAVLSDPKPERGSRTD